MKPAPFDYLRCETIGEAKACLARNGEDARILAGGQSLIAMLNMRLVQPVVLADISRIADLAFIRDNGSFVEVGAATTQAAFGCWAKLAERLPLAARALPHIGHFQTRNKGTVCGSLAHADPSSELPLVACVLDADIELTSEAGHRTLKARQFFTGLLETARRADEMIALVRLPAARAGEGYAFEECAARHGDFAMIAVAVRATSDRLVIGIGGGADRPEVRDYPLLDGSTLDDALNALAWELPLQDDGHASAATRRHLIRRLGRRCVEEAVRCRS